MATMLGSLLVSLGLESGQFSSGLTAAQKELKKVALNIDRMGKKIGNMGQKMTIGVTAPLVLLGKKSVEGFVEQEKAMADVNAALKSMGAASGKTSKELLKTADALEMNSLFDADIILKQVTANLLTFGNVAGKEFDRAQQAAVDMAERLGTEPRSAAIMLGKALNDPVKGISALTRVGIQFTDAQKAQIAAMNAAGDAAGAQGIILSEVERQFKGAAAAASDASPWRKAQVAINQAMDEIGAAILPAIKPVAEAIASIARAFTSLPESAQKAVVVFAAVAAALGPILMLVGPLIGAMAPLLAVMKSVAATQGIWLAMRAGVIGVASALGPMIVVAGAAYLVWKNWDDIAPRLQPLIDQLTAIGEGLGIVKMKSGQTSEELAKDSGWRAFGKGLLDTSNWLQKVTDDFDAFNQRNAASMRAFYAAVSSAVSGSIESVKRLYIGVKTWVLDRLSAVWKSVTDKIETVKSAFFNLYDAVVGHSYIPDMVDEIGQNMARLDSLMVDKAAKATASTTDKFREMSSEIRGLLARLFPEIERAKALQEDLAKIESSGLTGNARREAVRRRYAEEPAATEVISGGINPFEVSKTVNEAVASIGKAANDNAANTETANVRVVKSFKDMADATVSALQGLANAVKGGGFFDILGAVLNLGSQLGSMGVFGSGVQNSLNRVPAYANGTNYHPGGLALVGERGPELVNMNRGASVMTNSELRGMGGGSLKVEVVANNNGFGAIIRNEAGKVVAESAPVIAQGGASMASNDFAWQQSRRLA